MPELELPAPASVTGPPGKTPHHRSYDAFLSYSRKADARRAPALKRGLHRFARQWNQLRALRVFYDHSSLAAGSDLWESLQRVLGVSRHFVLLASPEAAVSGWVHEEVAWWREHRARDTFYIVLTSGTIAWDQSAGDFDWESTTALPRTLSGWFSAEPKWVDLRWACERKQLTLRDARFRDVVGSLAAPMHNKSKDELYSDDLRRRRQAVAVGWAAAVALAVVAVLAGWQAVVATQQRDEAERQRSLATRRALLAQADSVRRSDPQRSLRLGLAAQSIKPTAAGRKSLLDTLSRTRYAGSSRVPALSLTSDTELSPDGNLLATVDGSGRLKLWDVSERHRTRPVASLAHMPGSRVDLAFSDDGREFAAAADDRMDDSERPHLRAWDLTDPRKPVEKPAFPGSVKANSVAFTPDGRLLSGDSSEMRGRITSWDMDGSGRPRGRLLSKGTPVETAVSDDPSGSITVSPDGKTVVTASSMLTQVGGKRTQPGIVLWNRRGTPRLHPVAGIEGWSACPVFHPKKPLFALGQGSQVTLWRYGQGKAPRRVATLDAHRDTVGALAFNDDGTKLASGGEDHEVVLWDTTDPSNSGSRHSTLYGHRGWISGLGFRKDGKELVSADVDGGVLHWRTDEPGPSRLATLVNGGQGTSALALSPDGHTVASGDTPQNSTIIGPDEKPRMLSLWDITRPRSPSHLTTLNGQSGSEDLAFSGDGRLLANGGKWENVELWNIGEPRRPRLYSTLPKESGSPSVSLSHDGTSLAMVTDEQTEIETWNVTVRPPVKEKAMGSSDNTTEVAYVPGRRLLALSDDVSEEGWAAEKLKTRLLTTDGRRLSTVPGGAAAFGRDGEHMATVTGEGHRVSLWNVRSASHPRQLTQLPPTTDRVSRLAIHPRGRLLGVWTQDGTVTLWDISNAGRPTRTESVDHESQDVADMTFTPDGRTLVTGGGDGITLWDLGRLPTLVTDPAAEACEIANGGPTRKEWKRDVPGMPYRDGCRPK
ncbi:hypothetical protein ACOBQB_35435 [Streptomyces sp. G5(2025)]|uniref:hypothetical protein n=1 Tax=Streptomyces sp. G5(2025) TaxID=3406628 RepID=UPI003C29AD40